jgi:hypothetical protein
MTTVDTAKASDRARMVADQKVCACYKPHQRHTMEALAAWAMAFIREFHALTEPTPYPEPQLQPRGAPFRPQARRGRVTDDELAMAEMPIATLMEMARDAMRYRYLREHSSLVASKIGGGLGMTMGAKHPKDMRLLDERIDSLIAGEDTP